MRIRTKFAAIAAFFVIGLAVTACGSSVPSDSVASMAGNKITTQAFKHWMYIAAKQEALEEEEEEGESSPVIVPNDPPKFADCLKQIKTLIPELADTSDKTLRSECASVFSEYKGEVMDFLIEGYWYQAQAHKVGISISKKELSKELAKDEKEEFGSSTNKTELKAYLTETGETLADLKFQIRVSYLYEQLIKKDTKKVTQKAIETYYKGHLTTFGTKATADLHLIRSKTAAEAQDAYTALKGGASWDTVAKQYSEDASAKKNGGALTGITDGEEETAVNKVIFANGSLNKLQGPIKGTFGYYVLEVTKLTKATQESVTKASKTIKEILNSQYSSAAETKVGKQLKANWKGKTICRAEYSVADCTNYVKPKTTTSTTPTSTTTGTGTAGTSGSATSTSTSTTKSSTTKAGGGTSGSTGGATTTSTNGSTSTSTTGTSTSTS